MPSKLLRLTSFALIVLLLLAILLPFLSWLLSALEFQVRSLLSEEGLRWLFKYGTESLINYWVILFILFLIDVGIFRYISLWHQTHIVQYGPRLYAALFVLCGLVLLVLGAFLRHSPLLSVTGEFYHSPFLCGLPCALLLLSGIGGLIYAVFSQSITTLTQLTECLTNGISRYSVLLLLAMCLSFIIQCSLYCFI